MMKVEIMIERGNIVKRCFALLFAGTRFVKGYGWLGMDLGNT